MGVSERCLKLAYRGCLRDAWGVSSGCLEGVTVSSVELCELVSSITIVGINRSRTIILIILKILLIITNQVHVMNHVSQQTESRRTMLNYQKTYKQTSTPEDDYDHENKEENDKDMDEDNFLYRPICVAEGEGLSEKNSSSLAYWWATTFLKVQDYDHADYNHNINRSSYISS